MTMAELTHEPRQARSRETLRRIVRATLELARTSLDGDFTLREVAEVAGIAQGTLHARFPSKDELLCYVQEIFWAERVDKIRAFFAAHPVGGDPHATLAAGLALALAEARASYAVSQVFARAMVDSRRLASRHQHHLSSATRLVCDEVHRRTGVSDKRLRFAIRLVVAALRAPHPALDNPETRLPDGELVRELEELVLKLLELPAVA
jgi:AcrR family transcriptional regulator